MGTGYFFLKEEDRLYTWTFLTEKVACPLFFLSPDLGMLPTGGAHK